MARPQKNTVDYFPFYCEEGKKMFYLEETYGNDGFAVFVKLLRELARTDYHYLDLSKKTTLMFLSAKCKVSNTTLEAIINDLVDLEKFDSVLWNENKIIWCQDFIDSIQDAYIKRKNKCITYNGLLLHLVSLGVRKPSKSKSKGSSNTQTILEDTKEEEIKEKNIIIIDNSSFSSVCKNDKMWLDTLGMQLNKIDGWVLRQVDYFDTKLMTEGDQKKNLKEYKSHFSRWLPFRSKELIKQANESNTAY